jgi:hypothetical protein
MIVKKVFVLIHIPAECFQKRYFSSTCLRNCKLKYCPYLSDSTKKNSVKFCLSSSYRRIRIPLCEYSCYFLYDFSRSMGIFIVFLFLYFFVLFPNVFAHFFSVSLAYVLPDMSSLLPLWYFLLFITISLLYLYFSFSFHHLFLFFFPLLLSNSFVWLLLSLFTPFQIIKS